jgi:integrase
MKLDSKTIAALTLDGKRDVIHFDDAMPGFGFRLRLSGGKLQRSWVVQYKRGNKSRRITLGRAEVLGAEVARAAAKKALAQVSLGGDPQAERQERRAKGRHSLLSEIDRYLAAKQARPRTLIELRRYLTGPAFKPLHGMPVDVVARKDVADRLVDIERESGSIVAARARAALNTFFGWAMQMGIAERNPVVGTIQPNAGEPGDRVLSDDELRRIWLACGDGDHGRIIQLLILLGARRQEVGGMRWSELDPLEDGRWRLPAARSKNGRAHTWPLLPMVLDIIKGVPRMVSRDYLFGVRADGFRSWHAAKRTLDQRAGVTGWMVHDLRRTVATRLNDLGVLPHVVEQILNHQSGHRRGVAGIYNKSPYEREVRNALALWEDHIRTLVEAGERRVLSFQPPQAAAP